jgi:hypothetical protein
VTATFSKEPENLFVIHIQGILAFEDLKEIQTQARAEIDRSQNNNILILAEEFAGWGKEGDWGDLMFMYEYDPYIRKIAVVANPKWRDEILMFVGADRRQAIVKSFLDGREKAARDWLRSVSY